MEINSLKRGATLTNAELLAPQVTKLLVVIDEISTYPQAETEPMEDMADALESLSSVYANAELL